MREHKLEFRRAGQSDSRSIYEWRVHPRARAASRNESEFSFESHKDWFERVLKDKKRVIYMASERGIKIGQIRFDQHGETESEVSVSINPEKYGQGYGSVIIRDGSEKYLAEHSNVNVIIAEINPDNNASIRAFENAGYEYVNRKTNDTGEWEVYKLTRK